MRCIRAANSLLRRNAAPSAPLSRRTTSSLVQSLRRAEQSQLTPAIARSFSHTAQCQKRKAGGGNNNNNTTANNATTTQPITTTASSSTNTPAPAAESTDPENPFDFTDLQTAFDRVEKRFTEDLKKLRTGGRFNADVIGGIAVQPDKKSPQTFALRELATVAPLGGRRWSILAFEEASVKPIVSAVQRSDEFNQQPQRSADNPLELTMAVEPERADALAKRAKDVCQAWRTRVRDEAHRRGELHKRWRADGLVLSDDVFKLKDRLQKLQDERMKAILAKEKEVVGQIMSRA
ncbi:ribosome recycling factor-domain-containing protein [Chaetomidium leptoderma]|uniref:Ribosome recycling factor-domain-containing protein n=1 Tax=Chaetomidium leptoderma TaxID=669021 RepID=A0AAN6VU66_9PEZI|nr:ribosome recycling factor-domain-containing protein [Chaetomidium leptoderma]